MPDRPVNLFVYGSLRNPATFRAVTGLSWLEQDGSTASSSAGRRPRQQSNQSSRAVPAVAGKLCGFELVTPDDLYFYAVPRADRDIDGMLLLNVPAETIKLLTAYQGRHYQHRPGRVTTAGGELPATVFAWAGHASADRPRATLPEYVASERQRNLKAEFAIRARIDHVLSGAENGSAGTGEIHPQPVRVRALREIRGATVHDLVRAHFHAPGLGEFFIREALSGRPPSFAGLRGDADVVLYAESYLTLLVRQVILNQFERRVFEEHRFEIAPLGGGWRFFEHSVSMLAALRLASGLGPILATVAHDAISELDYRRNEFLDYVEWAVNAADNLYESAAAAEAVEWIAANRTGGFVPLSARLQLSNLAHTAGCDGRPVGFDPSFDSFRYFRAFGLNMLMWKLGGHVLCRPGLSAAGEQRGFLELALGSTGRRPDQAAPVTVDPWVLDRLIGLAISFYEIQPHGLAVALHLPRRLAEPERDCLPESVMRCLLALAGDVGAEPAGHVRVRRIWGREIATLVPTRGLDLMRILHPPGQTDAFAPQGDRARDVRAEYRFMRLTGGVDYQPIMLALKGVQLHYRPADMLTSKQMQAEPRLGRLFDSLLEWADTPTAIEPAERTEFLEAVAAGLACERRGRAAHRKPVVTAALDQLDRGLDRFNVSVGVSQ